MNTPIHKINTKAAEITELFNLDVLGIEDDEEYEELVHTHLSSHVQELMGHFIGNIHSLSTYAYGSERGIALAAFKKQAERTLFKGLETFLFKSQHWRSGRSVGPYLGKCLSKLAEAIKADADFVKKVSVPICPACKVLGEREFLTIEGKLLRCPTCTKETTRLDVDGKKSSREEYEYRLRKVFSLHSRKGNRCPNCERFIPKSLVIGSEKASCPYDDCAWFGDDSEMPHMAHPLGQSSGMTVSMSSPIGEGESELGDMFDATDVNPDLRIEQEEKYRKELSVAKSVIETQRKRLESQNRPKVIKKILMYKSFESLLKEDPIGMINYLIHKKSLGERPIQSLIFQRYVTLVENQLPLEIDTEDGLKEIFSIQDPDLGLFLGVSEFQTHVRDSGLVSNNTHEIFVGAKCNGPCFIGYLCDITDESGQSVMDQVEYYTFSNIKMKQGYPSGTLLNVVHFRIPPHYEMHSLVNLQRVRRKIVDSIYKRLNGSKRPLRGSSEVNKAVSQVHD